MFCLELGEDEADLPGLRYPIPRCISAVTRTSLELRAGLRQGGSPVEDSTAGRSCCQHVGASVFSSPHMSPGQASLKGHDIRGMLAPYRTHIAELLALYAWVVGVKRRSHSRGAERHNSSKPGNNGWWDPSVDVVFRDSLSEG